jgi:hypothetical protein
VRARDDGLEPSLTEPAEPLRSGEHVLQLIGAGGRGDVEQRPLDRSDGNTPAASDVARIQDARSVDRNAAPAPAPTRRRHVDGAGLRRCQAPPRGSASVTEHGARPTGKHRRKRAAVTTHVSVTHGIHGAVQAMKTPPMVDRIALDAEIEQLLKRHHSPLTTRQRRNPDIGGWVL